MITIVEEICSLLIKELHKQGLPRSNSQFLVAHGEEIQGSIISASLRALPVQHEI
jgi:hypothetical protein